MNHGETTNMYRTDIQYLDMCIEKLWIPVIMQALLVSKVDFQHISVGVTKVLYMRILGDRMQMLTAVLK